MKRIFVIEDERNMCELLRMFLEKEGYAVETVQLGKEALKRIKSGEVIDLIICDYKLPDIDGLAILSFLHRMDKPIPFVLITAYGTIETAVEAMKKGAVDFITKPFNKEAIRRIIKRVFHIENLERQTKHLQDITHKADLIYSSRALQEILQTARKVSATKTPVLITGESGTGKGLIAKAIHDFQHEQSDSGSYPPFIRINCPAIPEALLESELFGYQRGAFTGADRDFKGKVRIAEGGTLFLDEIAEIPVSIQPKLLRLLEEKTLEPLGSNTQIIVNTRIICATNREMQKLLDAGLFRKDLFYRINTITIQIPPVRDRREDIIPIAEYFIGKLCAEMGKKRKELSEEVKKVFASYQWPGNVREIRNIIERACVLSEEKTIKLSDIPAELYRSGSGGGNGRMRQFKELEKKVIIETLNECKWNVSAAAKVLGITRNTLRYRIKKHAL